MHVTPSSRSQLIQVSFAMAQRRRSIEEREPTLRHAPGGSDYWYFLSHKKEHSQHGRVPALIAQSLHDSLHQLGYRGWFDVDDLAEISRERIESAIEKCACMIVLLNDETHRSEWCQLEWLAAAEHNLPVKVILDLERCGSKADALRSVSSAHPSLMLYQWSDYTDRHRRACLAELCDHLETLDAQPASGAAGAVQPGLNYAGAHRRQRWSLSSGSNGRTNVLKSHVRLRSFSLRAKLPRVVS